MAFFTSTPITSNSYLFPPPTSLLLQSTFRNLENCLWLKKRRSKRKPKLRPPVRSNLQPSLPSVSFDLLSLLPPAALGFASALAISFSNRKSTDSELNSNPRVSDIGEWILFSTPTPFNRFVFLRCPSISFDGGEYVEDVSEKLVNEEKHFVWLDSGRIHVKNDGDGEVEERKNSGLLSFEYQRVCVSTDDGGVISLDWPLNLGLTEERGLDTTVLLIPGTPKGSMDDDVKCFVRDCLRQGLFPVVMNPRGCAGSPLTTARMFTAADSDDICSAIQYITRARPWSTLTGVGWGYGANMLTKYLAEAGEKTPLTAAICIDNPFDLDEATRTSPYCTRIDDKLTGGLIDILKSNKKLFQGRRKGFDVEKALSADSVRDFEKSISMVSHGFDTIEEFYTNSSTRSLVGKLKIPVLFVQNDNGTVPLFSIPRGPIAENPFACLLLCSCLPSNVTATSWYQQVAIEWLTAVELGFLKGRHPLLQDIDVSINPSKGLALVEGRSSDMSGRHESDFSFAQLDSSDAYLDPMKQLLTDTDAQSSISLKSNQSSARNQALDDPVLDSSDANLDPMKKLLTETDALSSISLKSNQSSAKNQALDDRFLSETNGSFPQDSSKSEDSTKDMETSEAEGDQGQVLPTAQVVMNMLDVTMPGTLKEEQKRKVLTAVGKGETLIKALEDAVPEDVRGKLTTSVSEILQTQGKNLNFDSLLSIKRRANASSSSNSKNKEIATLPNSNNGKIVPSNSEAPGDDETSSCDNGQVDVDKLGEATGSQPPKTSARSDIPESKEVDSYDDDTSLTKALNESQNSDKKLDGDASAEMVGQLSDSGEDESEIAVKRNLSNRTSGVTNSELSVMQSNRSQDDEKSQKESDISGKVSELKDLSSEQNDTRAALDTKPADASEATSPSVSETQQPEKQGDSKTKGAAADTIPADTNEAASPVSESQQSEKGDSKINKAAADTSEAAASLISETQQSEKDDGKTKGETEQSLPDQNRASDSKSPTFSVSQAFDALTGLDDSTQVAVNSVFGVLEDIIVQMEEKKIESTDNKGTENKDAINGTVTENDRSSSELQLEKQNDGEDKEDTIPLDMESVKGHDKNSRILNNSTAAASKATDTGKFNLIVNKPATTNANISKDSIRMTSIPYVKALYKDFLQKYILSEMQKMKHADVDSTTTPSLDNDPEDEHLLLLKQPGGMHVTVFDKSEKIERHSKLHPKESCMDNVIEPSYVILDKERQEEPVEELMEDVQDKLVSRDDILDSLELFVKTTLLNSLKVEVSRKLSSSDMENMEAPLAADMERVADAVYLAIQYDGKHNKKLLLSEFDPDFQEWSRLNGNRVTEAISEAVQNTSYLKKVLPIGVVVGSTLAALRNCFDLAVVYCNSVAGALAMDQGQNNVLKSKDPQQQQEIIQLPVDGIDHDPAENNLREAEGNIVLNALDEDDMEKVRSGNLNRDTLMVGAVTAALGASALLTNQQEDFMGNDSCETSEEKQMKSEPEDLADNKNQSNVVTSLAEKAMSVAAPVVPTREDGALDHDRLVTMLTELGQRGGMLKLVSKVALLWGGLRGAMSLTDRLISFLQIADRPLLHRVLGFSCMVLVLWSPVLLPLLPTLFHNMATHTSSRVVELACVFGLYSAVTILIIQWGKGIRGYEYPLKQYGLDFASSRKVRHLLIGFVGGIMLVVCIQSLNSLLGFVNFSFPLNLGSSSSNFSAKIKAYGQMFLLAGQGLLMAAGVAFVEELLFRSWLLEEIAADFGYHAGIFLSGLAFAVSQRSWQSIPGLWLLSLCLSGARLSKKGSLFIPIGLRTGLMASSYILQAGGFLVYLPKYPWWITGTQPFQPFNGVVGLLFALFLAIVLYPKQLGLREKLPRTIRA